ncbi:FecCD family ABC transporter permease [Natronoflexus pectinivorans]|nr:iron ABC transporter permease [Natronoflexus pectinivorans]
MMQSRTIFWMIFTLVILLLVLAAALLSLTTGEASISLADIIPVLKEKEGMEYFILTEIRMPRIILAFAVGGALSLSGAILQGIFRNPLVEPYTLGISGGAAFGVALTIVTGMHFTIGMFMLPLSGFFGAMATILLVSLLGFLRGGTDIHKMLLIGVMISFVASSSMMFLMSVTTAENLHGIIFWIMGSLDEPNRLLIRITLFSSLAGLAISYLFARPLNALLLGEDKAGHLGINSRHTIRILFLVASLLTGICVSVAGVIGFVGLVIPHLIRLIAGSDYRFLLIGSFLGGSFFLILSDVIARTIISPNELPIGVITGMAGGVLFIIVLNKFRNRKQHGG